MEVGSEKVNPYSHDQREKGAQVEEMFDNIAPAYDFMNRAMTLGVDCRWRKKAITMLKRDLEAKSRRSAIFQILDVATGTGDLAIEIARKIPQSRITGIDLSRQMVKIGQEKIRRARLNHQVSLEVGDCLTLPYPSNSFDAVTVAFGVRNFQNLLQGYREMHRVLKPGGKLCVIELSVPKSKLVSPLYKFYTRCIIPMAGRLASKDSRAYSYLPESIAAVPQREEMLQLMSEAGFRESQYRALTFGVCCIYNAAAQK